MATISAVSLPKVSNRTVGDDARFCVHFPRSAASLAGFRRWVKSDELPESVRVAFVDGEIYYDMSNEEMETHNKPKNEILRVLMNLNRKLKIGTYYGDGVLLTHEDAEVSNNPDGIFLRRATIRSGKVHLVPREGEQEQFVEIEGTPDWVMEVVSNGSVRKDTQQLLSAYHSAGIEEYWLIDARGLEIDFQLLHWRENDYAKAPAQGGWQTSKVFNRDFRLVRQRDDMGMWEYTLRTRPKSSRRKHAR